MSSSLQSENAIYGLVGRVIQKITSVEHALATNLALDNINHNASEFDRLNKKTLGELKRIYDQRVTKGNKDADAYVDRVDTHFNELIGIRNDLCHKFWSVSNAQSKINVDNLPRKNHRDCNYDISYADLICIMRDLGTIETSFIQMFIDNSPIHEDIKKNFENSSRAHLTYQW